jgi:uncharacterized coiled-coil DUF342 family protein
MKHSIILILFCLLIQWSTATSIVRFPGNTIDIFSEIPIQNILNADTIFIDGGLGDIYLKAGSNDDGSPYNWDIGSGIETSYIVTFPFSHATKTLPDGSKGALIAATRSNPIQNQYVWIVYRALPLKPTTPSGAISVCCGSSTSYTSTSTNAEYYEWFINPSDAGTLDNETSSTLTINWSSTFTGQVSLTVKGVSGSNMSPLSEALTISVRSVPGKPNIFGERLVEKDSTSIYSSSANYADSWAWFFDPTDLANASTVGQNLSLSFLETGIIAITTQAINSCGSSEVSDAFAVRIIDYKGMQSLISQLETVNDSLLDQVNQLVADTTSKGIAYRAVIDNLNDQIIILQAAVNDLDAQVNSLTSTNSQLEEQVNLLTSLNSELLQDIQGLEDQISELLTTNAELEEQVENQYETISSLEEQILDLQQQVVLLNAENQSFINEVENLNAQIGDLESQVTDLSAANASLIDQIALLDAANVELENEVYYLNNQIGSLEEQIQNQAATITALEIMVEDLILTNISLQASVNSLNAANIALVNENNYLNEVISDLEQQIFEQEELIVQLESEIQLLSQVYILSWEVEEVSTYVFETEIGNFSISLYPNPSPGEVFISCTEEIIELKILNNQGQLIRQMIINSFDTSFQVMRTEMPVGIYFVHISTSKGSSIHRLMFQ